MKAKNCKDSKKSSQLSYEDIKKQSGLYQAIDDEGFDDYASWVFIVDDQGSCMIYDFDREEFGKEKPQIYHDCEFVKYQGKLCIELEN